jgi:sugar O-acyltransferase (sialic acid O-acetyltransferase NeuD family)
MILIGYSGHAYVVCGILRSAGKEAMAYCDAEEKANNPFELEYLGSEVSDKAIAKLQKNEFFISIGDNKIRHSIAERLALQNLFPVNVVHASAVICSSATIHTTGVMISAGVIVNPLADIGKGAILNTGAVIEHECLIGDFVHIGPGAVLCGNVSIGENSFIGAGAVVRQGIRIGRNATVGAGSVVIKGVPEGAMVVGCPAK